VPFPGVVSALTTANSPVVASFAPEPFVSGGESQGQEIADTDRAAVENVLAKYLGIDRQSAAFISLPAFPLGVDAVRLQRVVSSMKRFGLLPKSTNFQVTSMITG
jgi:hypothetical protein